MIVIISNKVIINNHKVIKTIGIKQKIRIFMRSKAWEDQRMIKINE